MSWWSRAVNVLRAGRVDRDLDEELQFHLEARVRESLAEGLPAPEAHARARRRVGHPLRLREQSRDVKLLPWLESLVRDVRLAVRSLRKHPIVTTAALVSLALAVGACLAAFSVIDALILRPLAVRAPSSLIYLTFRSDEPGRPDVETFNDPLFTRLRDASRGTADLFAMSTQVLRSVTFNADDPQRELLRTQFVSGDAFALMGIAPTVGRVIGRDDDGAPLSPVAVLSQAFWNRRFGGDAGVVGREFTMDGRSFRIVGVTAAGFDGVEPGRPTDVWLPYAMYNARAFGNGQFSWFRVFGYVHPDASIARTRDILQASFTAVRRERAAAMGSGRPPQEIARYIGTPLSVHSAANGPSPLRNQFASSLWMLTAIAGLVLLVAGSNVANLQLARGVSREREMALRLSIGAGPGRLIQQVLIESAVLAAAASAIGAVLARSLSMATVSMLTPVDDPIHLDLRLDWRLVGIGLLLTLVVTAFSGLVPALRASHVPPARALGGAQRSTRTGAMRPFVAAQAAFGLVVLFVGGLLLHSFAKLSSINPGFASRGVVLVSLDVSRLAGDQQLDAVSGVVEQLRHQPDVQSASAALVNVLGRALTFDVSAPGGPRALDTTVAPVSDGFFGAMAMPIHAGRDFAPRDAHSTAIVVNETFAHEYFGDAPAVGRTIRATLGEDDAGTHEIIGVVGDARYDLRKPPVPTVYVPLKPLWTPTIYVRTSGQGTNAATRVRAMIAAVAPTLRVTDIGTQADAVARTLVRERLLAWLSAFFGGVGLVLVGVGLYGVLSFSVSQRTREIGIRMALGARSSRVVKTVLTDAGSAVVVGVAAGVAGGVYASRFIETMLFDVTPMDAGSLLLPIAVFTVVAALATVLPARRALRIAPLTALGAE